MKSKFLLVTILFIVSNFFIPFGIYAQTWNGSSTATTSNTDWNTSIQLTSTSWGAQSGLLFNAYRSAALVNGSLSVLGNTKHYIDASQYGNGAGAIMFLGNGGQMDFLISGAAPGSNLNVDWGVPKMSISRNGNVGIGTTTIDFKLTVNGKIKAEEVQVVVDVPADYVFEKDYNLMPLTEVEQFVTENKHLPGMPDAQSLINNGWQVGEMNNKLLEKVEELTLYIIELKKENQLLKNENSTISNRIDLIEKTIKKTKNTL